MSVGTLSLATLMLTPRSRHEPIEGGRVDPASARIFISYSRKDGIEAATDLRNWLLSENLSVWQDIIALEGGRDWWSQIEDALKSKTLQHFVLIVTAGCVGKSCRAPRDQAGATGRQDGLSRSEDRGSPTSVRCRAGLARSTTSILPSTARH